MDPAENAATPVDTSPSSTDQAPPSDFSPRHIGGEETFWIDDSALIVLEAEGRYFCARRSVLCLESRIFHDMLSLPQPQVVDPAEQYEGQPLVRLADKAIEIQLFLNALHEYRLYYLSPASQSILSRAAILRLSTKYEVPHLRERTIGELCSYFPTSLSAFDEVQDVMMSDNDFQLLTSVIEEAGVRRFLPVIKYIQCKRTPMSKLYSENVAELASAIPLHAPGRNRTHHRIVPVWGSRAQGFIRSLLHQK